MEPLANNPKPAERDFVTTSPASLAAIENLTTYMMHPPYNNMFRAYGKDFSDLGDAKACYDISEATYYVLTLNFT